MNNYILIFQRFFQITMLSEVIKKNWFIFFGFLILILWFIPYLDIDYQMVRKDDFLDGEFVYNHVYGKFIKGNSNAFSVFLNGNFSILKFSRAFQPLSFFYLFDNSYAVYFFLDFIVRIIAFFGMYFLVLEFSTDKLISFYLAIFFSLSISYSVHLLSVAGIPFLFWSILLADKIKNNIHKYFLYLLVFFIGLNTSLILSGVFVLVLFPFITYLIFGLSINRQILIIILIYLCGFLFNSIGLFYDFLLSDSISHRTEWKPFFSSISLYESVRNSLNLILEGKSFYHVYEHVTFIPTVTIVIFTLNCFLKKNSRSIYMLFLLILFILIIWVIKRLPINDIFYNNFTLINIFQWDRFYFLLSFLFCLFTAFIYLKCSTFLKTVIILALLLESFLFLYKAPHFNEFFYGIINYFHIPLEQKKNNNVNINKYFLENDYIEIKKIVKDHTVMSYQLDPMISPFNNITSADGYFTNYPLFYKHLFYKIIKDSIAETHFFEYFTKWGSRLYLFNSGGNEDLLNFCESSALNVRYILSKSRLNNKNLNFVTMTNENQINIYSINYSYCNKK